MSDMVAEALEGIKALGRPEEMVRAGGRPGGELKVNAHIHLPPNFSAFTTVAEAVEQAAGEGVGVLGVSNYYDYAVYGDFAKLTRAKRIFPLFGLEIIALDEGLLRAGVKVNDPGNPGKIYVCGKGITRFGEGSGQDVRPGPNLQSAEARRLLGAIRGNDSVRMTAMIRKLEEVFARRGLATGLTVDAVIDLVVQRHQVPRQRVYLQERHICQAFQQVLFEKVPLERRLEALARLFGGPAKADVRDAVAVQNEIRSQLMKAGKPAYIAETFVTFQQAVKLILELGGIPCYPTLADGTNPICPFEEPVAGLIERLGALGIPAAEFIPVRNAPQILQQYVPAMRRAGLVLTAGTEHNTLDKLPITPTCVKGVAIPPEVAEIFREGAAVVAGHQLAVLHGECGYVDGMGRLNPAFADGEKRIRYFRDLGQAVIVKYRGR